MSAPEFTYELSRGFLPGHRACAGCGQAAAVRLIMEIAAPNCIVTNTTGCLEVFSTPHPESATRLAGRSPTTRQSGEAGQTPANSGQPQEPHRRSPF